MKTKFSTSALTHGRFYENLYHAIENTANQNTEKPLYIKWCYIQLSHHAARLIVFATVFSTAWYKIAGFHTTKKFKLQNYWSKWDFTFMISKSSWKLKMVSWFCDILRLSSKLLRDAAFTRRPRELSCWLKSDLFQGIWLSEQFLLEKVLF